MEKFLEAWMTISVKISSRYFLIAGLAFLLFYVLFRRYFRPRKIQAKFPEVKHYRRDLMYSVITILIFATVGAITFTLLRPWTQLYSPIDAYGWGYYALTFVMMFFLHDAYFYWMHRLMHHPQLFKAVHLIHHKSTNPSPWTSYAFHPLEAVIETGIIPLIAFAFPVHGTAIGLFMLFQFVYNVYGHLGYELYPRGFHKTPIGRWVNTSVAHNLHHGRFHGNYGLYPLIWDRLCGTLREDYEETYERTLG